MSADGYRCRPCGTVVGPEFAATRFSDDSVICSECSTPEPGLLAGTLAALEAAGLSGPGVDVWAAGVLVIAWTGGDR